MPNGTGRDVRVLVFAKDVLADDAKDAGADYVGSSDMVEKVKGGWTDVDVVISAPDMMAEVGKLGKILGPRGLMPNPKVGTVTSDIAKAVKEQAESDGEGVSIEDEYNPDKDPDCIHIFSLASGHAYERFQKIMFQSLLEHTNSKVKFWLLDNFASPQFKDFVPVMAKEYGFYYEFVSYNWPHWLRRQTQKQRVMWGYKILFLDVLLNGSLYHRR